MKAEDLNTIYTEDLNKTELRPKEDLNSQKKNIY